MLHIYVLYFSYGENRHLFNLFQARILYFHGAFSFLNPSCHTTESIGYILVHYIPMAFV